MLGRYSVPKLTYLVVITLTYAVTSLYINYYNTQYSMYKKFNISSTSKLLLHENRNLNIRKWIVVTSINEPTPQIKRLASIKNFQLLVVGDNKTDQTWFYENTIFLNLNFQNSLPFSILKNIPLNSYTRKNIGNLVLEKKHSFCSTKQCAFI